jgi:ectoine hydroxylase-related dioxygenase (phytanoyl-CoA dioxygenase family)
MKKPCEVMSALERSGFAMAERFVNSADLFQLQSRLTAVYNDWRRLPKEFRKEIGSEEKSNEARVSREINGLLTLCPDLSKLNLLESLAEVAESALGGPVALSHDHAICKPAKSGARVLPHQDGAYDGAIQARSLTCWVPLSKCTVSSGTLYYFATSTHGTRFSHVNSAGTEYIDRTLLFRRRPIGVLGEAGLVAMHFDATIHGSFRNVSSADRIAVIFRFSRSDL